MCAQYLSMYMKREEQGTKVRDVVHQSIYWPWSMLIYMAKFVLSGMI